MSKARVFDRIFLGYRKVELAIAEVVHFGKNRAYKRQIDAIEKKMVQKTLETVSNAVSGPVLQSGLTSDQKARTKVCFILKHTSKPRKALMVGKC